MARQNGTSRSREFQPPPSSMLATHVVNGGGQPKISQADFAQLLQESLGTDEHGHTNIGNNAEVNFKLLSAVMQIGIESHLLRQEKNPDRDPFQPTLDQGRNATELQQSLEVVALIIEQTPKVIFQEEVSQPDSHHADVPPFACLLPLVIALSTLTSNTDILRSCSKVLDSCLKADDKCSCGTCGSVAEMIREVLSVLVRKAFHNANTGAEHLGHQADDSAEEPVNASVYCKYLVRRLDSLKVGDYFKAGIFIAKALSDRPYPRTVFLQLKKQLKLLENAAARVGDCSDYKPDIESVKSKLSALSVANITRPGQTYPTDSENFPDSDRARKRPRLSIDHAAADDAQSILSVATKMLTQKLTGTAVSDFHSLPSTCPPYFRRLSEPEQRDAIGAIGHTVCRIASPTTSNCLTCDTNSRDAFQTRIPEAAQFLDALEALQPHIERSAAQRLIALEAYRRVLNHIPSAQRLRINASTSGKFALQMLRSTTRDCRLAAAKLLQSFVRSFKDDKSTIVRDNRIAVLEYLQSLWQSGRVPPQEAVVLALRNIAEVVGDEELNIILLRLVEYLGHTNSYVSAFVASELVQLAQSLRTNMQGLLRPYWRTIGIVVAKTLSSRPAIAQQLCELLGMQINGLLQLIEESALPYLVVQGHVELIQRIASSDNSSVTTFDVCYKKTNLPKILAALLAQGYPDPEDTIMKRLVAISPDFGEHSLSEWLSINHSKIACELLKSFKDVGMGKESRVFQGLQLLAQLAYRKPLSSTAQRRNEAVPSFLDANAWEIVTDFTREFDDTVTREITAERRRCLLGLGQLARLGRGRVNAVIPQICACLRSALPDQDLCDAAFQAWTMVITSLGEDEVVELLDQTFAITLKHWPMLSNETQTTAKKALVHLFKTQPAALEERAELLPPLSVIPELGELEAQLQVWREQNDELSLLQNFVLRLNDETLVVAQHAMTELMQILRDRSAFLHRSLSREQPDPIIAEIIRAILDCATRHADHEEIVLYAAQCLGTIGKVDSSRVDSVREKQSMVLLSNFAVAAETVGFLMFFMERVVVKEYVSASSLRSKTFLGWALQELLQICQITPEMASRTRVGNLDGKGRQWFDLSEGTRLVLTPFIASKFIAPRSKPVDPCPHPVFRPGLSFEQWLTQFTLDLLSKGRTQNVDVVFEACWKMVHFSPGTAISSFIMPYATLNLLLNGSQIEKEQLRDEILCILQQAYRPAEVKSQEIIRLCSQAIFDMIDYLSKWLQDKRKWFSNAQIRAERGLRDPGLDSALPQIEAVENLLKSIPPEVITQRSIECKSYSRALLHWDEYIHLKDDPSDDDYRRLQNIYAQIDEPDGVEGISTCMHVLNAESQIMEHSEAGRWQAVQNWYEMQMTETPHDVNIQVNLLHALRESGQHDTLLHHFTGLLDQDSPDMDQRLLQYAMEAAWSTAQFDALATFIGLNRDVDFTSLLARSLLTLSRTSASQPALDIDALWLTSAKDLSFNSTSSISACGDILLKMHVVEDLRLMTSASDETKDRILEMLDVRTAALGTDVGAKQYVLSMQRALMHLHKDVFIDADISASWLKTAKLARKAHAYPQALDAVLRAESLGDQSVVIEKAKLMWLEGRHRKAIKTLESAIDSGIFQTHSYIAEKDSMMSRPENQEQNNMVAKAYVLLGKWLDQAGQTQSEAIIKTFRKSTEQNKVWESGWYHLGRHYNRILESEKSKAPGKEIQPFLVGEAAKIVIENFLRALACGNKYLFQTLPKVLTLWLELVSHPEIEQDSRRGNSKFHEHLASQRRKVISETNAYVKRYAERLQPVSLYTILPQLVARICHANQHVYELLQGMIARVVHAFPQQALWTLMAVTKSVDKTRAQRGLAVISKVVEMQKKKSNGIPSTEFRQMISSAQRFTDELLRVADYPIEGKVTKISLARELGFNHKIAPSKLVVPAETCLIPNIPTSNDIGILKTFRAFSKDPVTITAFLDEALVLTSLQKPRKMSIRGSDGHLYAILAKPKDDLRKDQRLIEFDTMINRFLKRDIEASKRRLYIRTYAVVPLNEECGVIEWVNSLKTMRDVLLKLYRERNVIIDYRQLQHTLDDICARSADKAKDFTERILPLFPPILRYWFIEVFPDPDAWLNARIRYTRSAAVMSMVGHILGLGDRHGENVLFEEDNGGIMHVDFNCLFDKGLTFEKPEMVPFRLTHNMVDAFGVFGIEGPFRHCCEITMTLLRNHEDGLMTILETFLHDPTTDFMTAGKRRKVRDVDSVVPDTAEKMLEGVKGKVRGMLRGESVPLSVGGYVEEMIRQASSRANLARMYIGWCAFL